MQLQIIMILFIKMTTIAVNFRPIKKWPATVPMMWVDGRNREPGTKTIDTFYDRVLIITNRKPSKPPRRYQDEVTGVLITTRLILTSFNPLKFLAQRYDTLFLRLTITYVTHRLFDTGDLFKYYFLNHTIQVVCARPVVPTFDENVPDHMRHGPHCPLHDLMVMRTDKEIDLYLPVPQPVYVFKNTDQGEWVDYLSLYGVKAGPILTVLATEKDRITENLSFVSIAHLNEQHIKENRYLEKEEIFADDNAITDCDEWLPREWGYFFCIRNVNNFPGIASGGMLFSEGKLFGVGSFALWKGKKSILVFTDIRPYSHLLFKTCTEDDQNLVKPTEKNLK